MYRQMYPSQIHLCPRSWHRHCCHLSLLFVYDLWCLYTVLTTAPLSVVIVPALRTTDWKDCKYQSLARLRLHNGDLRQPLKPSKWNESHLMVIRKWKPCWDLFLAASASPSQPKMYLMRNTHIQLNMSSCEKTQNLTVDKPTTSLIMFLSCPTLHVVKARVNSKRSLACHQQRQRHTKHLYKQTEYSTPSVLLFWDTMAFQLFRQIKPGEITIIQ